MSNNLTILDIGSQAGEVADLLRKDLKPSEISTINFLYADDHKVGELWKHDVPETNKIAIDVRYQNTFPAEIFNSVGHLIIVSDMTQLIAAKFTEKAVSSALESNPDITIDVVAALPFLFEGMEKIQRAVESLRPLMANPHVNVTICNNEDITQRYPDKTLPEYLYLATEEMKETVEGILALPQDSILN